jgi:hypothetical protein
MEHCIHLHLSLVVQTRNPPPPQKKKQLLKRKMALHTAKVTYDSAK